MAEPVLTKTTVSRILAILLCLPGIARAQPSSMNGVKLSVTYQIEEMDMPQTKEDAAKKKPNFSVEVSSVLTNVSNHDITLPTSTYTGNPTCEGLSLDSVSACFQIGFRLSDTKQILSPSPYRYFPVTLKPGESTELPRYETGPYWVKRPSMTSVKVIYFVEDSFAARYGWWSGSLLCETGDEKK